MRCQRRLVCMPLEINQSSYVDFAEMLATLKPIVCVFVFVKCTEQKGIWVTEFLSSYHAVLRLLPLHGCRRGMCRALGFFG